MAGADLGLGHAVRSLRLGEALRDRLEIRLFFARYPPACRLFRRARLPFETVPAPVSSNEETQQTLRRLKAYAPEVVLFDRLAPPMALARGAGDLARRIVLLDSKGPVIRLADVVINGIIEPENVRATHNGTRFYGGPDYLILDPALRPLRRRKIRKQLRAVTISVGGSDPMGTAARVTRDLLHCTEPLVLHVAAGLDPPKSALSELSRQAARSAHRIYVHRGLSSIASLLCQSDVAITGGGLTAFESLCAGLPTLALAQVPHQARTIARLRCRGLLQSLGSCRALKKGAVKHALSSLTYGRRLELRRRALRYLDGRGIERVTRIILRLFRG